MIWWLLAIAVLLGLLLWMSERELARSNRELQLVRFVLTQKLGEAYRILDAQLWPDGDDAGPWPPESADFNEWTREMGPPA